MVKDSDLSEYELIRLENIRRNAEFLAQLGIQPLAVEVKVKKDHEQSIRQKKKAEKVVRNVKLASPVVLRRSSRNSGKVEDLAELPDNWNENGAKIKVKTEKAGTSYEEQPMGSDELDDFEFQVFVKLRGWRLSRCRELDIEPYKIFQNRTLCELVRHRRNDPYWAAGASGSSGACDCVVEQAGLVDTSKSTQVSGVSLGEQDASAPLADSHENSMSLEIAFDAEIAEALTDCWGVGPAKVKESGFAWEALAVLNSVEVSALLVQSRALDSSPLRSEEVEEDA